MGLVELRLPHHVADAVSNEEEQLNDVGGERCGVECKGPDFGYVGAEGSVDAAAFNTKDYA